MSIDTELDDYWTQQLGAPAAPPEHHLNIEIIGSIEPLDAQFGVVAPKTVPDALYRPLFGQPEPTEDALEQVGGDLSPVLPLHTYAILDAGKMPGLPELLVVSGLEHRCLFQGAALEDLADVAPWVVRLEEGNSLVRNLFTRSDAVWHLWDHEPGIYLRSHGTIDDIWNHFRKFTKVTGANDTSLFFRFWDAVTARVYFSGMRTNSLRIEQFFRLPSGSSIELIVVDPLYSTLHFTPPLKRSSSRPKSKIVFEEYDHQLLREVSYYALSNEIAAWLRVDCQSQFKDFSGNKMSAISKHVVSVGRAFNLTMKEDFSYLTQMMMTMGGWFAHDAPPPRALGYFAGFWCEEGEAS